LQRLSIHVDDGHHGIEQELRKHVPEVEYLEAVREEN